MQKLSKSCPKDTIFFDLKLYTNFIVDLHNKFRNQIAGGKIPNHLSAVRMGTVEWDWDLAYLAGLNVKTCEFDHDQCRNTVNYPYSGQNIARKSYRNKNFSLREILEKQIQAWFDEHEFSNMKEINAATNNEEIGHFTAMIHENSIRVGCAAVEFKKLSKTYVITTCNYSHTNILGKKIYRSGKTASECTTGRNTKYPNLCSKNEKYNVKKPLQ